MFYGFRGVSWTIFSYWFSSLQRYFHSMNISLHKTIYVRCAAIGNKSNNSICELLNSGRNKIDFFLCFNSFCRMRCWVSLCFTEMLLNSKSQNFMNHSGLLLRAHEKKFGLNLWMRQSMMTSIVDDTHLSLYVGFWSLFHQSRWMQSIQLKIGMERPIAYAAENLHQLSMTGFIVDWKRQIDNNETWISTDSWKCRIWNSAGPFHVYSFRYFELETDNSGWNLQLKICWN